MFLKPRFSTCLLPGCSVLCEASHLPSIMKKLLLASLAMLALATAASAQKPITLKWADYGRFPPSDNVLLVDDLLPLANIRNADTNAVWDLSGLYGMGNEFIRRDSVQVVNSGGMPGYEYDQPEKMALGNVYYPGTIRFMRDTFALQIAGRNINAATISLDTVTGAPTDKLVVPQQYMGASGSPETVLKFPVSMNSNWVSQSQYLTSYELTVAAAQYNQKPLTCEADKRIEGTVIGWGRALVKDYATNQVSDSMDVLQVQIVEVTNNNYTSGGAPLSPAVLNALNLRNGADTVSYIWLMRKGETTPLLSVRYRGMPSSTPERAWLHNERIPGTTAVASVLTAADGINIYPNPVRKGGTLSIACETAGNWRLRLSSTVGQQVLDAGWEQRRAGVETLPLPQHLAEGIYIFQVLKDNQPVKTGRLLVAE